ncbi:hypothetical protein [Arcticibacterium luteifluviistationis]|uniref:Uncharacterized protein n=1 Tax=Arcticibacterium luteifluviistationis TaxID=1784714 RepID=A0A2Z4GAE6_9BACT|nr:hypothetical protein [Arcticibacterium luteifluviistationis]AWV98055.1 hypothetical protein DJ013_07670 [Arcticibacterium luteifluviistationis]
MELFDYKCHQVKDEVGLMLYQQNYQELSGNLLTLDYLKKTMVFHVLKNDKVYAGFSLNVLEWSPLRYFSYLNEYVKSEILIQPSKPLKEQDFLEITSIYKQGRYKKDEMLFYFYLFAKAYINAKRLKKPLILGGSIVREVKLIQKEVLDVVLYHGLIDPEKIKGDTPKLFEIYCCETTDLLFNAGKEAFEKYFLQVFGSKKWH